jgi:nitroreductase/NAD-dependent dihydropyrimidine dehydrogenase PreA subunit
MNNVDIDRKLCNGCGLCIPVCPDQSIVVAAGTAEIRGEKCMECGHCLAVCPQGAISIPLISTELGLHHIREKQGVVQPGSYDCAGLVHLMRSRRSCRNFKTIPVELSLLQDLVKIGTTAPSGTNSQGWNFTLLPSRREVAHLGALTAEFFRDLNGKAANPFYRLLTDLFMGGSLNRYYRRYYSSVKEALREYDEEGKDRLFHGAEAAILVTVKKSASCPGEDALLASQNILLAAHALGLGSCLIGFVVEAMRRRKGIKEAMDIPETEEIHAVIGLGYPDEKYSRVAGRKKVQPRIFNL